MIHKMIEKHGLEITVGIALDGGIPDVELGPPEEIVLIDDLSASQSVVKPVEEVFGAQVVEDPIPPPLIHVISDPEPFKDAGGVNQSLGEEDELFAQALRRNAPLKIYHEEVFASDEEPDLPASQLTIDSETMDEDPLLPLPVFSRRLDLDDDDSGVRERDLSLVQSPKKRRGAPMIKESAPPAPKRQVTEPLEPIVFPALAAPQVPLPLPLPQAPIPAPSTTSTTTALQARKWSEEELKYIKTFETPPRLTDLPPYDYGRMLSLQTEASGVDGAQEGNVAQYLLMSQAQYDPSQLLKSVRTQMSELVMVVDSDFAYSPFGGPIMDALYAANIPILAAKLPCRNTIIWRRKGHEFQTLSTTSIPPPESADDNAINPDEPPFNLEDLDTMPEKAIHPLGPLNQFQVELNHFILVLTPQQFASAKNNELELPFVTEAKQLNPGKALTLLILHPNHQLKYPFIAKYEFGSFMAQIQLKHKLHDIMVENGAQPIFVATNLAHIHRALSIRPYEFISNDGPFFSFDHLTNKWGAQRDSQGAYLTMLQAAGLPPQPARAITAAHGNPINLFRMLRDLPNQAAQLDYIAKLPRGTGQRVGIEAAHPVVAVFAPQVHPTPPYQPHRQ